MANKYILIFVEGNTEREFFTEYNNRILKMSPPFFVEIINGAKGSTGLIKLAASKRKDLMVEHNLTIEDISTWVVMDEDNDPRKYKGLKQKAEDEGIQIAYSKPKFEAFLLAIFKEYGHNQTKRIDEILSKICLQKTKEKYSKGRRIMWIIDAIDKERSLLQNARNFCKKWSKNSNGDLFFTLNRLFDELDKIKSISKKYKKNKENDGLS